MCKISIVVPVYNAEKTIKTCVNSILAQTFTDFELILVSDGSTDNSDSICRELAEKDSRINFIRQANSGPASVRNLGIEKARGEYLCFCDSDDYIDADCLDFMYNKAISTLADIVLCGYYMENGKNVSLILPSETFIDSSSINEHIIELKTKNIIDPPWNKLYKLDFIRATGIKMPVADFFEDTYFNLGLLRYNPVIAVYSKCFYHYILQMGSLSRRYNPKKIEMAKDSVRLLKKVTSGVESSCDFLFVKYVFSSIMDMFLCCKRKDIIDRIIKEISTDEFKSAALNAKTDGRLNKEIIKAAQSGNANTVYRFCFLSYILKYKMQRLFMKVRSR